MQANRSRVFGRLRSVLLAVVGLAGIGWFNSAFGAADEVLKIDTRFGPVAVVKAANDCCKGAIQHRGQKIEIVSAGEIYATREGLFQTAEGDVVVLSIPTGARGMPPNYFVLLVKDSGLADITDKNFASADGTFTATQRGNEIAFDLGWENRKRKTAFYRAGVIYVGSDKAKPGAQLSRTDCEYVLNTLADCRKTCPADEFISMSVQRNFVSLEEKPIFKIDNFFKICKTGCGGTAPSTAAARLQLCGY